jgi:predicted aldo/keto reductase-like oxidoreductase
MILNLNYRRFGLKMLMERGLEAQVQSLAACSLCDHHECVGYCAYHLPIPALMQQLRRTYTPIIKAYQARQNTPTV